MSRLDALFAGMRTSASGLTAERARIDVIARNIANAHTTRTPQGGPYQRKVVHFEPILQKMADGTETAMGVRVSGIENDTRTPFEVIHDPSHPDADAEGNVQLPNVNATQEMANMITALRAYDANVSAQENFMRMAERALRLFD